MIIIINPFPFYENFRFHRLLQDLYYGPPNV
jgi:hypothetical protein